MAGAGQRSGAVFRLLEFTDRARGDREPGDASPCKERIRNYQPPAQTVQPWWFGDEVFKGTSFFLRELPKLLPTNRLTPAKAGTDEHKAWSKIHRAPPGLDRWKIRSETVPGIAAAAALQWGGHAVKQMGIAA